MVQIYLIINILQTYVLRSIIYEKIYFLIEKGGKVMTNEEFQRIVLEELRALRTDINGLKEGQKSLEEGQRSLGESQRSLEEGQRQIIKKLDAVWDQTVILTEFKEEVNSKLDTLLEENQAMKEIIGVHSVDIKRLKNRVV